MPELELLCRDCGSSFYFSEGQQDFYAEHGLIAPQHCVDCRNSRKNERGNRQLFSAVCAQCGAKCQVPYAPRPIEEGGRPILCKACFSVQFVSGTTQYELPVEEKVAHGSILVVVPLVNEALIKHIQNDPRQLYDLDSRRFEELIAFIWDGFGFDVELTARTRDGGYDIVAISNESANVKFLIECKRYKKTNKVGVEVVRSLRGVVEFEQANKGILVTTSSFTKPARQQLAQDPWLLDGRDFDGIVEWLATYDKLRTGKIIMPRQMT